MENVDESVEYAKVAFSNIKEILVKKIPSDFTLAKSKTAWIAENIFDKYSNHVEQLNKNQLLDFFNEFLEEEKLDHHGGEENDVEVFLAGPLFNKIFQLLDDDKSGRVSKKEVCDYFTKIVGDERCEGPESGSREM